MKPIRPLSRVTVRVPATTSNLGPGFDTLGIALRLFNRLALRRCPGADITLHSPISPEARPGAVAMLQEAARLFFDVARLPAFGAEVSLSGDVPVARGLGSSVTVRLGVMAGLNALAGCPLSRNLMLDAVTSLEHHPDNATPAVWGGFTIAGMVGSEVRSLRFPVSSRLRFVALIPRFEVSTEKARRLVPSRFTKADAIHNLNRAALVSAAFAGQRYSELRGLFDDRIHQPYRQRLIPQLPKIIQAGERAGAIGGWLSGSGSTIICMTLKDPDQVGAAMRGELPQSDVQILRADDTGLKVTPH